MFKIIKKTSVVWWHEFNGSVRHISNFVAVADINAQTFMIRSISGAYFPLEAVNVLDIVVIDETDASVEETFTSITDLVNRLVALQYTPYKSSGGGGATTFTGLTDTPNNYTGQSGKVVSVKSTEDGLEFVDPTAGAVGNLQQVTDNGATTTNPVFFDVGSGITTVIANDSVSIENTNTGESAGITSIGISISDSDKGLNITPIGLKYNKTPFYISEVYETPTANRVLTKPNESGTFATREWVNDNVSGGTVDSVNGQTGAVVLDADDISDTSTAKKFVTASEKTAITHANRSTLDAITEAFTTTLKTAYDGAVTWISTNGTNLLNHISNNSNPHNVTKTQIGLGNVDNTSDLNKPISTATQTALDLKLNASAGSNIAESTTDGTASSGTSNTVTMTLPIPANTNGANQMVDVIGLVRATGTAGTRAVRLYVNTSPDLSGTPILIGAYTGVSSTALEITCQRFLRIKVANGTGAGTEVMNTGNAVASNYSFVASAVTTCAIDWTALQYLVMTVQATNGTDSLRGTGLKARR